MQAQLDLTQEIIANGGQPLSHPKSLLSADEMEELGQELVKLCDGVSIFGLVDYQMGVAEEQILECQCCTVLHLQVCQADHDTRSADQMPGSYHSVTTTEALLPRRSIDLTLF